MGEVSFTAWNYKAATRITGPEFPQNESFGAWAWAGGSVFMDDETVVYQEDKTWKPDKTYYWPKDNTVDFFCYYPPHMEGIGIEPDRITYNNIDVHAMQQDILYSDLASCYADDPDKMDGPAISGLEGVPALFHHALSKVQVKILLPFNHKTEPDGTVTDWEVKVGEISLSGIRHVGGCELLLPDEKEPGPVQWVLPLSADGCHVWSDDGSTVSVSANLEGQDLTPGEPVTAIPEFYVLPQTLLHGEQQVSVNLGIKTIRNGALLLQESLTVTRDLRLKKLPAWQMNQAITYILRLSPLREGTGINPDDPYNPDDPDLSGAIITFDPATSGWENIGLEADINL